MFSLRQLSIQLIGSPSRAVINALQRGQPGVVLVLDPDPGVVKTVQGVCPSAVLVGRLVAASMSATLDEAGGNWLAEQIKTSAARSGIKHWLLTNERLDGKGEAMPGLVACELAAVRSLNRAGLYPIAGGFSVGTPDLPAGDEMRLWSQFYPVMGEAWATHIHEYGVPSDPDGSWTATRHTRFLPLLPLPLQRGRFLVSECGWDMQGRDKGWKTRFSNNPKAYIDWLMKWAQTLPVNFAATIFKVGWGWPDFDVAGDVLNALAERQSQSSAYAWGEIEEAKPMSNGWCPFAVQRPLTIHNYFDGRQGYPVKAVVLHIAAGPLTAIYPTFNQAGGVSAHFGIGKDGAIEQYVSIWDAAWQAGLGWDNAGNWYSPGFNDQVIHPSWPGLIPFTNPNLYTLGIEHEGQPEDVWTPAMLEANNRLLVWLADQLGYSNYVPGDNLVRHADIDPRNRPNCPGPNVDLQAIASAVNTMRKQTPNTQPTVDPALIERVQTAARQQHWMPVNVEAALYKFAQTQRLGEQQTDEFDVWYQAQRYKAQGFREGIVIAKEGDWDNCQVVQKGSI